MPTVEPGLTIKSLAEMAWLVSKSGHQLMEIQVDPPAAALRGFWQCTRQLQRSWDGFLDDATSDATADLARFEETLARLLTTEMLARVWATILGGIDMRTGRNDLTRIAVNVVSGLLQIRQRMLSLLVTRPGLPVDWAADQDRLRRRCDRWTDLLIGSMCSRREVFRFAYDPDRAKDFAEDATDGQRSDRPLQLLVAAGVRLSFLGQLPDVSLDSPAFEGLIQSILRSLPEDFSLQEHQSPVEPDVATAEGDVLLPGISLDDLRRRFS